MAPEARRSLRAAVVAMTLGDGCIRAEGSLGVKHSTRQAEYLRHKAEIVQWLQRRPVHIAEREDNTTFGVFPSIGFITQERPLYKRLRKLMYPSGVKTITRKALDYLDVRGLAIWFMDDGSTSVKKRNGKAHSTETTLNTYCSKDENQVVIDYFNDVWGVSWGFNKSRDRWRLRMGTQGGRAFARLIEPHIIPSMRYKIAPLLYDGRLRDLTIPDEEKVHSIGN